MPSATCAVSRGQYPDMQELEMAQFLLILQLTQGPIQKALSLPFYHLKLIRELLNHLELRKHNV